MIRNDSYDTPEDPPCTMCPNLMPCQWCPHHPPTRQALLGKQPLRQEPPPGLSKDLCLHVIRRSKASSMGEKDKHPPSKYDTLHAKKEEVGVAPSFIHLLWKGGARQLHSKLNHWEKVSIPFYTMDRGFLQTQQIYCSGLPSGTHCRTVEEHIHSDMLPLQQTGMVYQPLTTY